MNPKFPLLGSALALSVLTAAPGEAAPKRQAPNIIFILTDDLGGGDLGVFFQNARRAANDRSKPWHSTPNLDAFAAQGLQIPQHYCSSPVCAPSRASLLLGVHQGHANVRDNQFDKALENNVTLPGVLKQAGYATACIGKWGLQGNGKFDPNIPHGWPAHPQNRGFDSYFGYIAHGDGHGHYPKEDGKALWDGDRNVAADYDGCYTTDLFTARAKKWIEEQHAATPQQPFFLYLAYDTPHAKLEYPPAPFPGGGGKTGGVQWIGKPGQMINTAGRPDSYCHPDYATATWDNDGNPETPEKPWPDVYKRYATSVRRIDDCVGDLMQELKNLGIDDNTLVVFTSDNGPSQESYLAQENLPTFFESFGPHDGIKRDLWEGGIRVGALVRWPREIPAGRVTQSPSAFWDWLPTFAEAAGAPAPARTDGVSLLPTLRGNGVQQPSRLYFEYFEPGSTPSYRTIAESRRGRVRRQMQALRLGDFIGVRYDIHSHAEPFEIYNIVKDSYERHNLAEDPKYADLQQQMHDIVLGLRRPDPNAPRPYDAELVPAVQPATTAAGVAWMAGELTTPWLARIEDTKPTATGTAALPGLPDNLHTRRGKETELLFSGYIKIPRDGEYTLSTTGPALLRVHEAIVLDSGLTGGDQGLRGTIRLRAGLHPFRYYRKAEAKPGEMGLKWSSSEIPEQDVPASAFSH
jgi:arylsulfatase A-like enzyme